MRNKSIFTTILCILIPCSVTAADQKFVETSEGIIKQLTKKKEFGQTRSFTVNKSPTRSITVRVKEKGKELEKMILVKESTEIGVARLKVEFDVSSARLRPTSANILDQLRKALIDVRLSGQAICIKGHTDSDGDNDYNRRLSYQRAESVREYVTKNSDLMGIDLLVVGYGEQMPLSNNTSPADKQMNRRVEITLGCSEVQ